MLETLMQLPLAHQIYLIVAIGAFTLFGLTLASVSAFSEH